VRDGKLDRVLTDFEAQPADIYAVYPARDSLPARTSRFIDTLVARLGPVPPWRAKGAVVA
jgi:DNA-binding transcriptional LysR family regulator